MHSLIYTPSNFLLLQNGTGILWKVLRSLGALYFGISAIDFLFSCCSCLSICSLMLENLIGCRVISPCCNRNQARSWYIKGRNPSYQCNPTLFLDISNIMHQNLFFFSLLEIIHLLFYFQFDVTFPALPCSLLSLDAMDISGEQHLDVVRMMIA